MRITRSPPEGASSQERQLPRNQARPRVARSSATSRLWLLVIAIAVAVAAPALLIFIGDSPERRAFLSGPEATLWVLLLSAQAAVWVGSAPLLVSTIRARIRDLRRRDELATAQLALIVAAVLTLLVLAVAFNYGPRLFHTEFTTSRIPTGDRWPLPYHTVKMPIFSAFGYLVGLTAIVAMWLATVGLNALAEAGAEGGSRLDRFIELRTELMAMLAVAGAVIGLATLSTGALRQAVLAANDQPLYREQAIDCLVGQTGKTRAEVHESLDQLLQAYPRCRRLTFDARYVVAYGLFFTALLAIAFYPSLLALRRAGARLRNDAFPLPNATDSEFFAVVDRRSSFDRFLQTDLSASATFKAGVAIATPLVASLLSTVLPTSL